MTRIVLAPALLLVLGTLSCADAPAPSEPITAGRSQRSGLSLGGDGRYVVLFDGDVRSDFSGHVSALGGIVEAMHEGIGVAVATGLTASAAAEIATAEGVRAVEPDIVLTIPAEDGGALATPWEGLTIDPPTAPDATSALGIASPAMAAFYARQWNLRAVRADAAWDAGRLGSADVSVAILDSGIDYLNPELQGLVDLARSVSLVPEDDALLASRFPGRHVVSDMLWHGTATASVIASNAVLVAGVTRHVTLFGVKVIGVASSGSAATTLGRILSGIVYAADHGADVINLSLALDVDKSVNPGAIAAMQRAANYAFAKGAVLVSVSGNSASDLDRNGDGIAVPCEFANVVCVSATGPTAAAGVNGPWTDVDAVAPYSSFGRSAVSVAAPGGTGLPGQFRRIWVPCTTTFTEVSPPACRARQPLAQGQGTSFAGPHAAGLAALLVEDLGKGNPAQVRARILQSADDLGAPGVDPFYGKGRLNVARALGLP